MDVTRRVLRGCVSHPPFESGVQVHGRTVVVRVLGDLDVRSHQSLVAALAVAIDLRADLVVLDLDGCGFVGQGQHRAVEEAASSLTALGSELLVRHPPPSFAIIGDAVRAGSCASR